MSNIQCPDCDAYVKGNVCPICGWQVPAAPKSPTPRPAPAPPVELSPEQRAHGRAKLAELVGMVEATIEDAIDIHARRILAHMAEPNEGHAWALATEMAEDPAHVAECPLCQQHPERPREAAMRRMAVERYSRQGMQHIMADKTLRRILERGRK
ncbi:MAG: hypothetical protein ABFD94_06800 [Armatimonadia bacterium]